MTPINLLMTPERSWKVKASVRGSRSHPLSGPGSPFRFLGGRVCAGSVHFSDRKALLGVGGVGLTVPAALPSWKVLVIQRVRLHVPLGRRSEDQQLAGGWEQVPLTMQRAEIAAAL